MQTPATRHPEARCFWCCSSEAAQLVWPTKNFCGFKTYRQVRSLQSTFHYRLEDVHVSVASAQTPPSGGCSDTGNKSKTKGRHGELAQSRRITPTEINWVCLKASPSCIQHLPIAGTWFRQSQQSLQRCQTTLTVLSTALESKAQSRCSSHYQPGKGYIYGVAAAAPTGDRQGQQHPQPSPTSPFGQCPGGVESPALPGRVLSSPPFPKGERVTLPS